MKLCMKHQRPKPFIVVQIMNLDLLYGKVKFCKFGFYMGKCNNDEILLHPVPLNLVNYSKLNE